MAEILEICMVNFRSGVSSGASRPIRGMIRIHEILSAKSFGELKKDVKCSHRSKVADQPSRFLTQKNCE